MAGRDCPRTCVIFATSTPARASAGLGPDRARALRAGALHQPGRQLRADHVRSQAAVSRHDRPRVRDRAARVDADRRPDRDARGAVAVCRRPRAVVRCDRARLAGLDRSPARARAVVVLQSRVSPQHCWFAPSGAGPSSNCQRVDTWHRGCSASRDESFSHHPWFAARGVWLYQRGLDIFIGGRTGYDGVHAACARRGRRG